jgi:hypothetical protein
MANIESRFQAEIIKDIRKMFNGCIILKNDASYLQGVPDLLVLFGTTWAALECKANPRASRQPNQDYYVAKLNDMSFAAFVFPENKDDILHGLQLAFRSARKARISQRV